MERLYDPAWDVCVDLASLEDFKDISAKYVLSNLVEFFQVQKPLCYDFFPSNKIFFFLQ